MRKNKCLSCGDKNAYIRNQGVLLCNICNLTINNKIKSNYQDGKTVKVLEIIMELNEWSDNKLFNNHKKSIKE